MSPTAGEDYGTVGDSNPPSFVSVTIPADESFVDIEVPIIDDECDENDETFGADLMIPADQTGRVTLGTPNQAVVTIVDNDGEATELMTITFQEIIYRAYSGVCQCTIYSN